MKNVAGKTRKIDNPYASWTDPSTGWEYRLLKSWQGDNSKEYGRWFMAVKTEYTFGSFELGDEYVKGGLRVSLNRALCAAPWKDGENSNGHLTYDNTIWETAGEFAAWAWGER